jgi:hypothetical protein
MMRDMSVLLAQDTVAIGDVFVYFLERLLTPAGIAAFVLGLTGVGLALAFRKGLPVLTWAALFSLTFMIHEATLTQNILIGPFQAFRALTRPISFALMSLAMLAVIGIPRPERGSAIGFASIALFAFQIFYAVQLMFFVAPLKGFLAMFSMTLMFVVCGIGFRRSMYDAESAERSLRVFFWVSLAFLAVNFLQLAGGISTAVINGRFVGISGNANQAGAVCGVLLLCCAYFVNEPLASRPRRIVAAVMLGLLGLLLAWTGSRASALAGVVGIVAMYRLRLGRLAIAGIVLALFAFIGFSVLTDSTEGAQRLTSTENTRAAVFAVAISDWMSSPIFGTMPFGFESGVESVLLRALASMGVIGGLVVLVPTIAILLTLPRALWTGRVRPELRALSDFYVGSGAFVLVTFLFEGYLFGVLTFVVMFVYVMLSVGSFLDDVYRSERSYEDVDGSVGPEPSVGLPAA